MNDNLACPAAVRLATATFLVAALASAPGAAPATGPAKDALEKFHVMEPFWASRTVHEESLMFIQDDPRKPAWARLLFAPAGGVTLKSADWKTAWREGKDFTVDREAGVLRLTAGSAVPFNTLEEIFPTGRVNWKKWRRGHEGKQCLLWAPYWGRPGVPVDPGFFARRQVEVTYDRGEGDWPGPVPKLAADKLARTLGKLKAARPITMAISGDGVVFRKAVSSGAQRFTPYMPWYGDLVAETVERLYGSRVTLKCHPAVWVANALGQAKQPEAIAGDKPDLIVLAYGVGDLRHPHGGQKVQVEPVVENFRKLLEAVRRLSPEADVILLTPIPSHPEWSVTDPANYAAFRDGLSKMTGEGVALADATALAEAVVKRKGYYPLAGDGVEMPGDYGHLLLAQAVCGLLTDPRRRPAMRWDPWAVLSPPWAGRTVRGERLLFIQEKPAEPPAASLMFPPAGAVRLTALDRVTVFSDKADYTVDPSKRRIILTDKTRIPFFKREELYTPAPTPGTYYWGQYNCMGKYRFGDRSLLMGYDLFTARQPVATYDRAGEWSDYVPAFAGKALPGTTGKLASGAPVRLTALGDSITLGGDASGFMNRPPGQPRFADLVAAGLKKACRSNVHYTNISRAGARADWGGAMVGKVLASDPDLVIVAFGMNDFGGRGGDAAYRKGIARIIEGVREKKPEAEFVLVSSMWHIPYGGPPTLNFLRYQRALKGLCGRGVALADMTALFEAMLQRKRWHDVASGINHPNDFSHRLYAQTILGLLIERFGRR